MTNPYNASFFEAIRGGCQASAAATLPLLELPETGSAVDVGGGEGWWGRQLLDKGWIVEVWDGPESDDGFEADWFLRRTVDLRDPLPAGDFDVALCLEVAEHLPPERGPSFVADLCGLAPYIVFSAAMPNQGGTGHINCQPPAYWASLFHEQGYRWTDPRDDLWNDPNIEPWYKSNLLIFQRHGGDDDPVWSPPLHKIHVDLWFPPR